MFHPQRAYREPVDPAPEIPSTYVDCSQDRTVKPDWSRREAAQRLSADIVEIDAGHSPHVSRPTELADVLDKLSG